MKIINIITGLTRGGTEASLYKLINNDNLNKHLVICLGPKGEYKKKFINLGIKVIILDITNKFLIINKFLQLVLILKKHKPDIVQTWLYHSDFFGGLAARIAGLNKIFWNIRHFNDKKNRLKFSQKLLIFFLSKFSFFIPTKIISNSISAIDFHIKLGFNKKKFIYIPNGFDGNEFYPNDNFRNIFREKYFIEKDELLFGIVARWHEHKNYTLFFNSLKNLKNFNSYKWKVIISGPGISKKNLDLLKIINQNNLEKNIIINQTKLNINYLYNAIDFLILSSYAESFPNVLGESMCSGTPCISTNVGDSRVIINKYGWICNEMNEYDLCDSIKEAIIYFNDKDKMSILKNNCRKHILENYNISKMIISYYNIWKS